MKEANLQYSRGMMLATITLGILVSSQAASAQHTGDVIIGINSNGQLAINPTGFVPDDNYFTLPVGGLFFPGWADSSPGFDHVVAAQPQNDIYPMQSGASIHLEVVGVDPAFQLVVLGNPPQFLDTPGESTFLGDHTLHEHLTFHINSDSPDYDPDQCVWHASFLLYDVGSTTYADSQPFTFQFTNIDLRDADGDFDVDADIDSDDFAALAACLQGPNETPTPSDPQVGTCEVECINAFDFDEDFDVDLEDYAAFCNLVASE